MALVRLSTVRFLVKWASISSVGVGSERQRRASDPESSSKLTFEKARLSAPPINPVMCRSATVEKDAVYPAGGAAPAAAPLMATGEVWKPGPSNPPSFASIPRSSLCWLLPGLKGAEVVACTGENGSLGGTGGARAGTAGFTADKQFQNIRQQTINTFSTLHSFCEPSLCS